MIVYQSIILRLMYNIVNTKGLYNITTYKQDSH